MKGRRYLFMDVLRLLSALSIVYFHILNHLAISGIRQSTTIAPYLGNSNMHIAKVAVGVFFMLSGAGLMLSHSGEERMVLRRYYTGRFFTVLVPFYVVYLLYMIVNTLFLGGSMTVAFKIRSPHPLSAILTLLGMDEYFSSLGIMTFSTGIGEWFLGALVMMYIIFPVLRAAMSRNKWVTMACACVVYAVVLVVYPRLPFVHPGQPHMDITVRFFDFVLGMFLITVIESIPGLVRGLAGACILIFYLLYPYQLPISSCISMVIQSASVFFLAASQEWRFEGTPRLMHVIRVACGYSYVLYLVHHVVIIHMTQAMVGKPCSNLKLLVFIICELAVMSVCAVAIKTGLDLPRIMRNRRGSSGQTED